MDLKKIKKVYIIGIEGAGTSALARMFSGIGVEVIGSDDGDHFYSDMLEGNGIKVFKKFNKENIPADIDLIVYSIAFKKETNVEVARAEKMNKPLMTYGEAVALLFNKKYGISVCGTHGKTTTTAWLSYVMDRSGLQPNMIVGAKVPQFEGNGLVSNSDYFILESDEYGDKLKYLRPKAALLNNIDYDHPDFFASRDDYETVFIDFIKKIPTKGFLVANFDDPIIRKIANVNCRARVISYALEEAADYIAYDIKNENGKQYFKVKLGVSDVQDDGGEEMSNNDLGDFAITLSGKHNIYNALAVIATCIELNLDLAVIRRYLEEFSGTARRMQLMGYARGAVILDDYAHHPTEIKASLAGVRAKHKDKKIITVFQPHTFTRTKALLDDFALSFKDTDELILIDIYGSARERQGGVHSKDLLEKVKQNNSNSVIKYISTLEECEEYLRGYIGAGDVVILMGAGDIFRIGEKLVN